jgi:cell division inhibitor SulA
MGPWILPVGLGLSLGGALVLALADAWLSRSILVYLDAVEANVTKMVEALRAGSIHVIVTSIDLKRDRRQNLARGLKTVGWLALAAGFGLQLTAAYLTKLPT